MTGPLTERPQRSYAFGPFVLYPERQLLLKDAAPVRIGSRALDILTALVERPGVLVTKAELIARAWPDTRVEEGNLKVNMVTLRRALGETQSERFITNVPGRGYRFTAGVHEGAPSSAPHDHFELVGALLPPGLSQIFGRGDAFSAVTRQVQNARIVSIVGPGGIGKTTLAVAVAQDLALVLPEGVAFVDLATITDPRFIPTAIACALGIGVAGPDSLTAIASILKSRDRLLLFDNCEHLLPSIADIIDRLIRQTDLLRVLATSREPLRLRDERVHRLAGLAFSPKETGVAVGPRELPAVALFTARALERSAYRVADEDAPAVAAICQRLDGNPLAIELASTQTTTYEPSKILQMLDDSLRLLSLGPPDAPARQRSLLATLDWSYGLLSRQEAKLVRAVSVFASVFTVSGAAAVAGHEMSDAADALAQLAAKSMLVVDPTNPGGHYRLLETTRAYGIERLRISGEADLARARHATFVCALLESAGEEWSHRPAHDWGATYRHLIDDLRQALAWANANDADLMLQFRLTVAGLQLWNHFSLIEECREHVVRAIGKLDAAGLTGTEYEMKLRLWLGGSTLFMRGLKPDARDALLRASEIAVRLGDQEYHHRSLMLIAAYELFTGQHNCAHRTLDRLVAAAATHDPTALPDAETHLGIIEIYTGRLEASRRRLERVYRHNLQDANDSRFARFLYVRNVDIGNVLSWAQWLTGSPDTSARTAELTVDQAQKTGHVLSLSNALAVAACPSFFLGGRFEECGRFVQMLSEQVARHGIVIWHPKALFYRAALEHVREGASDAVVEKLQLAIAEFRRVGYLARMPFYLSVLSLALTQCERFADARAVIEEALDCAARQNERWCVPELLRVQASLHLAQSRSDDAEALLKTSLDTSRKIGALSWRLRAANDLARILIQRERRGDARKLLSPIFRKFSEGFATPDLLTASGLLENPGQRELAAVTVRQIPSASRR